MTVRLAVLADIHAALPVLEAALAEIEPLGVDGYIVAGDMLSGPNPVEVLRRLRGLNCCQNLWMIRGNHENYHLSFQRRDAPDWWYTARQWSFIYWNYLQLDPEALEFIAALPEEQIVRIPGTDPIRVVHGSPRGNNELVFPDKDSALLDECLAMVPEPVLIFGHTHLSWQVRKDGRLALNPGSLSGNFSGPACGGYAILEWQDDYWQASLHNLPYDLTALRAAYRDSGLLEAGGAVAYYWLVSLETNINILPRFVEFAYDLAGKSGFKASPFVPDAIWEQAHQLFMVKLQKEGILPPGDPAIT